MADSILLPVRPCVKCGATDRTPKGACRTCAKRHGAAYRLANKEKAQAYMRAYYAANKDDLKSKSANRLSCNRDEINRVERQRYDKNTSWRKRNPDRDKATTDAYRAVNSERRRIYEHNRRAIKLESGGALSPGLSAKLFELQKGMCPCCTLPLGDDYHMDHKMPLALGGTNADDNMQLLRKICNLEKQAKHPVDFMQSRGFLL